MKLKRVLGYVLLVLSCYFYVALLLSFFKTISAAGESNNLKTQTDFLGSVAGIILMALVILFLNFKLTQYSRKLIRETKKA